MSVSAVSGTTTATQNAIPSGAQQLIQDFQALSNALQSNDLSGAQQAFGAVQKDIQNVAQGESPAQALGQNTPLGQDFRALQNALQSNNLSGAQQAFASLEKDLAASGPTHTHRHHKTSGANARDGEIGLQANNSSASGGTSDTENDSDSDSSSLNQLA